MKKIGIVTFHSAHNFGAVLQCIALKNVVKGLGYDVSIVDHHNILIDKAYTSKLQLNPGLGIQSAIKSIASYCLTYLPKRNRIKKFNRFIEKYIFEGKTGSCQIDDYDCLIFGSDQIWRPDLTDNDLFYWGKTTNEKATKISYAASAGIVNSSIDANIVCLRDFKAISVRERELCDYLQVKGLKSTITIDPTLLVEKNNWMKIIPLNKRSKERFILLYSMRNRKRVMEVAKEISLKESLPIIEISNNYIPKDALFNKYCDGGPIDFLSLINDAAFVVTDSFHGTAFSIIFQKQFVTIKLDDGHDNRSETLLCSLGLSERLTNSGLNYYEPIDYNNVEKRLAPIKNSSIEFLRTALL